jgi:hypothetical protein
MSIERELKQKNEDTEQKTRWYKEDLPSLIERDKEASLSHENKLWALGFANPEDIGMSYWSKDFRCITAKRRRLPSSLYYGF